MLNKKRSVLSDIVVFGSPRTVHLNTNNKSLSVRGKALLIIGKDDEMKAYRVYISKERVVVVTKHVRNIEKTLTDIQNIELVKDSHGTKGQEELDGSYIKRFKNERSSGWTCDRHLAQSRRDEVDKASDKGKIKLLKFKTLSSLS